MLDDWGIASTYSAGRTRFQLTYFVNTGGMLFELLAGMRLEIRFIKQVLAYAAAAAVLYCIAAVVYIKQMSFEASWILYVGNFLFAAVIGIFIAWFYKKHEKDINTVTLVSIGAKTAVAGIVMACIINFILVLVLVPGIFKAGSGSYLFLRHSPAQFEGKNQGFGSILFFNAILGNAGASFFISLLIPFSVMKNLYGRGEKPRAPSTKNENPKKNYNL
jgi:hypothetical protein